MSTFLHDIDDLSVGYLIGLLSGEGSFGGDGVKPQITLRMHTRHAALFHWLLARFPGSALYGPYGHGGRSYYQWMARGAYLRRVLAPLIQRHRDWLDDHAATRFYAMCENYKVELDGPADVAEATDGPLTVGHFRAAITAPPPGAMPQRVFHNGADNREPPISTQPDTAWKTSG